MHKGGSVLWIWIFSKWQWSFLSFYWKSFWIKNGQWRSIHLVEFVWLALFLRLLWFCSFVLMSSDHFRKESGFIFGAAERNRTPNLRITKPLLYLLSYDGTNGQFDDQSSDSWMIAAPAWVCLSRRSSQPRPLLRDSRIFDLRWHDKRMAVEAGIEPTFSESESAFLPLKDSTI